VSCAARIPQERSPKSHTVFAIFHTHKTVYIDDSFDDEQRDNIYLAMKSWEYSTSGIANFTFVDSKSDLPKGVDSIIVEPVSEKDENVVKFDAEIKKKRESGVTLAVHLPGSNYRISKIIVVISRVRDNLGELIKHETGHALRLTHSENRNSIMYFMINEGAQNITSIDIQTFCQIYWCNENELVIQNF
jgi:hypothetical protein